jgi:hypothetical protein
LNGFSPLPLGFCLSRSPLFRTWQHCRDVVYAATRLNLHLCAVTSIPLSRLPHLHGAHYSLRGCGRRFRKPLGSQFERNEPCFLVTIVLEYLCGPALVKPHKITGMEHTFRTLSVSIRDRDSVECNDQFRTPKVACGEDLVRQQMNEGHVRPFGLKLGLVNMRFVGLQSLHAGAVERLIWDYGSADCALLVDGEEARS